MNVQIAHRWVAELNRPYTKGRGRLVNNHDQFCPLGVLCNIAAGDEVGEWRKMLLEGRDREDWVFYCGDDDYCEATLPQKVREWSGIVDSVGTFFFNEERRLFTGAPKSITQINDGTSTTFAEVALLITKYHYYL